jgi:hypothetical protein
MRVFRDFSRPSGEEAWEAVVERALESGSVDGIYADCYYKFPFKCPGNLTAPTHNCRAVRNGSECKHWHHCPDGGRGAGGGGAAGRCTG